MGDSALKLAGASGGHGGAEGWREHQGTLNVLTALCYLGDRRADTGIIHVDHPSAHEEK